MILDHGPLVKILCINIGEYMKFDKVIKSIKKKKKKITYDDGIGDRGPTGFTGDEDVLRTGKIKKTN